MALQAYDPTKVRQTAYDVLWNAVACGGVDAVKITADLQFLAVKIGSAGPMKLDDRFQGLGDGAKVSVVVREPALAKFRSLVPWAAGSGAADLAPPIGTQLYQYAQQLTLHPRDMLLVTTEDIEIFKTVPISSVQIERDGVKMDQWEVDFAIYPDRTKLAAGTNPYWHIKGA